MAMKEKKSMTEHTPNPFHKDADPDCLFNICIGKSWKKGTEDFLLNVSPSVIKKDKVLDRNA